MLSPELSVGATCLWLDTLPVFFNAAMHHHIFSMRCRDEGVLPTSLRIRPPVKTREGYRIAEQAGKAFLSARMYAKQRMYPILSNQTDIYYSSVH